MRFGAITVLVGALGGAFGGALGACAPRAGGAPRVIPREGMTIAIHGGERPAALVEDVRWVEVGGGAILLDRIDPDAALASVVIEPLAGAALRVGACVRPRLDPATAVLSPLVRCATAARPGRYLVRVLHVASIGFRAQHAITLAAADRATIATRFAIATPAWRTRATVTLHDRRPGGTTPARELARGPIVLDGGTGVLALPVRTVPARLRHIYEGMVADPDRPPHDLAWGHASQGAVRVWLEAELPAASLPAGDAHVHVALAGEAPRDVVVPAGGRVRRGAAVRWPLWIDEDLWGRRTRTVERADGAALTDRVQLSVFNGGAAAREVWLEEPLRPARTVRVTDARPAPAVSRTHARRRIVIAPGATARLSFTVTYGF